MIIHRCEWANSSNLMKEYHDKVWGIPVHDDQILFEMLILEGKSCGLSWELIWKKSKGIKQAFDNFIPEKLIRYDSDKIDELMQNPNVIKHRLKIEAVVKNARAYLELKKRGSSLNNFLWSYTDFKTIVNEGTKTITTNDISDKLSKDLKKIGFRFVGSTIIYSFMQAIGMIDDHQCNCSFKMHK